MELFIKEQGKTLIGALTGAFVVVATISALIMINVVMPIYKNSLSGNSSQLVENVKKYSPRIDNDEIIYAKYKEKNFDLRKYIIATDYDGTDITGEVCIEGEVNLNKKGLYTVSLYVKNKLGYGAKSVMRIIVE